jgi:hypothetical protein
VLGQQLLSRLPLEEDNPPRRDPTTIQWLGRRNVGNKVKGRGLVEVVVVAMDVEAVAELLQILAELTSTPSLELYPHSSQNDIKRRGVASSATRRDTVSYNARSLKARRRWAFYVSKNDGGKAALPTSLSIRLHLLVVLRHGWRHRGSNHTRHLHQLQSRHLQN